MGCCNERNHRPKPGAGAKRPERSNIRVSYHQRPQRRRAARTRIVALRRVVDSCSPELDPSPFLAPCFGKEPKGHLDNIRIMSPAETHSGQSSPTKGGAR